MFSFLMFGTTYGHMGISITAPTPLNSRDLKVGDAYRYPNSGHCHGISPRAVGATFSSGDSVTLTLSNGAAHDGGHCALFLASKNSQPTEQVWYKQMDEIDCTKKPSFTWTVDGSLAPPECKDGCTLIWVWTPKSSGACEIYMNCFDIAISNPTKASTVQITRPLTCSRVNGEKKTSTYGKFCGTTCADTAGGGTDPSTASPGSTSSPAPVSPSIPNRCGATWIAANENCANTECVSDDSECPAGTRCYADMIRVCTTTTATASPVTNKCRAIGVWSGVSGMDQWCAASCPAQCPHPTVSHCECGDSTQALNPTTTKYQPTCQVVTSVLGDTIASITAANDLSSNIAAGGSIAEKTTQAAYELYLYNFQCNKKLEPMDFASATWPKLPVGTKIYLTGDCQLTDACVAGTSNSAILVSTNILMCVIAMFGTVFVGGSV